MVAFILLETANNGFNVLVIMVIFDYFRIIIVKLKIYDSIFVV